MAKAKATTATEGKKGSKCPITKAQFKKGAKPIVASIGGKEVFVGVKDFSTGSVGWYANEKVVMEIDGVPCKVQVSVMLTVIGSKEAE